MQSTKKRYRPQLENLEDRRVPTTTLTWTDTSGDHSWYTPGNWSGDAGHVPDSTHVASFDGTSTDYCNCAGTEGTGQYEPAGVVTNSGFTSRLYVNGNFITSGGLTLGGGHLDIGTSATVSVLGAFNWNYGNVSDDSGYGGTLKAKGASTWNVGRATVKKGVKLALGTTFL